jgi:hypothetical protein
MYKLFGDRLIRDNVAIGTFEKDELIDYLIDELNELKKELDSVSSTLYETEKNLMLLKGILNTYK